MNQKQLLYIDLDSTIFNFQKQFNKYHTINTGEDLSHQSWDGYELYKLFGLSKEHQYKYLSQANFFEDMKPYDNAIPTILDLIDKYSVFFVTTCVVAEAFSGKYKSLKKHLGDKFDISMLITMQDKHILRNGIIIDDNPYTLSYCKENGHTVIKFCQDYNSEVKVDHEITQWSQIRDILLP